MLVNEENKVRIASFDVDAQRGFTPLCPNELPVPEGDKIVDELNVNAKFADFRVGSKDAHPPEADWTKVAPFAEVGKPNVDIGWPAHCVVGTEGFELLPGLPHVSEYDFFVYKGLEKDMHPYGACYHDLENQIPTGVIGYLKRVNVGLVIVGGLATDYCVKTTALQLWHAGFDVVVNLDSCRGVAPETTATAIKDMTAVGIDFVSGGDELDQYVGEFLAKHAY